MSALHEYCAELHGTEKRWFDPQAFARYLRRIWGRIRSLPLVRYLDERLIVFSHSRDQSEAIDTLIDALNRGGVLRDKDEFRQAILNREKLMSTGIGLGIAVPHAKLPGYDRFFIAIGVEGGQGIEWDAIDGMRVHLIFMIGGPEEKQTEYLNILSRLTAAMKDGERRKRLLKATSAQQIIDMFKGF